MPVVLALIILSMTTCSAPSDRERVEVSIASAKDPADVGSRLGSAAAIAPAAQIHAVLALNVWFAKCNFDGRSHANAFYALIGGPSRVFTSNHLSSDPASQSSGDV